MFCLSALFFFFFRMLRRRRMSTLFPYTTLFRSFARAFGVDDAVFVGGVDGVVDRRLLRDGQRIGARAGADSLPISQQRSEEHTSELQSRFDLVCRLLLEKKKPSTSRSATIVPTR